MSFATTLVDRRRFSSSLGWIVPFASITALLSNDSLGASLENFHGDLVPSLKSKTGRGGDGFSCCVVSVLVSVVDSVGEIPPSVSGSCKIDEMNG